VSPVRSPGRYWRLLAHFALLAGDLLLVIPAFYLAYLMRYRMDWPPPLERYVAEVLIENDVPFRVFWPVTIGLIIILGILFEMKGLYRLQRGAGLLDYLGIILSSITTGIAILIVVVFLIRPFYYSRLILAFTGLNLLAILCLWRAALLGFQRWCWANGLGLERVLVVGGTGLGQQVMLGIAAQPHLGYSLVGYLDDGNSLEAVESLQRQATLQRRFRHLGSTADLPLLVAPHAVSQVILALPFWEHGRLPELVQQCHELGVDYRVAPDLYQLSFDRVDVLQVSGVPLIELKELSLRGWNLALKRGLDVLLVLLSLPFTLALGLLLALVVRLDSSGAAILAQERVGKHGRLFRCYKFRTMVANAEERKAELAQLNEADGPLFKIKNDPRVTRVGRFLRRTSLDELPQLWNVLMGEMSLVGPRPGLPAEVAAYEPWHRRRLEVLPGMTGLSQTLGRSDLSWDEIVRLDIYYAENWTLGMDLRIMLQTVPAVLQG
jgi:exopolysaccharide biosynthesis polyprenyl glycosylphosphotransferase